MTRGHTTLALTSLPGRRLYIFGDTLLVEKLKEIPARFDDYAVFASPLADFTREMQRRGLGDRIVTVNRGASVTV